MTQIFRALLIAFFAIGVGASAQQPINATNITFGTLAPARIADGALTSAKLGGDVTSFGKTLIQRVDAAAARASLGLVIGTDVQAYNANTTTLGNGATGSGNLVRATSPTLTTPSLGVASATSINNVAITAPASTATLTIGSGKTFSVPNTLTLSGTDGSTLAIGTGGTLGTMAYASTSSYVTTTTANTLLGGKLGNVLADTTVVTWGSVADGQYLRRSGASLVGDSAAAVSAFKLASRSGSEPDRPSASGNSGRAIRLVNLGTGSGYARSIWQESDGTTWGNVNGVASLFHTYTPGAAVPMVVSDTQYSICPTVTVPGGLMGPNTLLRVMPHVRASASQANNALRVFFGGQVLYLSSGGWHDVGPTIRVANAGATNAQTRFGPGNGSTGFGLNAVATYKPQLAIDTSVNQDITITAAGTAGDTMTCMGLNVELVDP